MTSKQINLADRLAGEGRMLRIPSDSDLRTVPASRAEIEKAIEPIILDCLRKFGDYSGRGQSAEDFAKAIPADELRPDTRRVSLILSLARSVVGEMEGEGLELGCGYCFLLFPMAVLNRKIHWTAVEHPRRRFFDQADFRQALRDYRCELVGADVVRDTLPFPDGTFSIVTFSETIEHLPTERLNFVLGEISRVLRPQGVLIASSPNQASWENRLRLLKGKSILDLPEPLSVAKDIFGHIRLYTPEEMRQLMSKHGFSLVQSVLESNNSPYRRQSHGWLYRWFERAEQRLAFLRSLGDTWYMVFRKNDSNGLNAFPTAKE
jgi:SAM-dependent methyltransferase